MIAQPAGSDRTTQHGWVDLLFLEYLWVCKQFLIDAWSVIFIYFIYDWMVKYFDQAKRGPIYIV